MANHTTGAERYNRRMHKIFDDAKASIAKREAELQIKFPLLAPCCAGMLDNSTDSGTFDRCATCDKALIYDNGAWRYAASNPTAERIEEPQFRCDRCGKASFGGFTFGSERVCRECSEAERDNPASDSGRGDSGAAWIVHVTDGGAVYISDSHDFSKATFAIRADGERERAERIVQAVNGWEAMRDALENTINGYGHFVGCSRRSDPKVDERYCNLNCREIRAALRFADPQQITRRLRQPTSGGGS